MVYKILYTKQAKADSKKLCSKSPSTKRKISNFLQIAREKPYEIDGKKLKEEFDGAYSVRVNDKDRFIYEILDNDKIVKIIRILTHYGD